MKQKRILSVLIEAAVAHGLPASAIASAREYLEYGEYELCLDTITDEIDELQIQIRPELFQFVEQCAETMKIDPDKTIVTLKH